MVFATLPSERLQDFFAHLEARRIRVFTRGPALRLVAHLDIDDAGLERAIGAFRDFYN
jgi:threonine aldolase